MKNLILIIFTILYAQQVFSAGAESFSPSFVGCFPSGICFIGIEPPATLTTCPTKSQIRFDISLPGSTPQYSAALTALVSGKQINAALTDTCINGFPGTSYLYVKK